MPVLDTEVLFALNPKDQKHEASLKTLNELQRRKERIFVPDVVILEFQIVLRSINKEPSIVKTATLALKRAIQINHGEGVTTINLNLLARQ